MANKEEMAKEALAFLQTQNVGVVATAGLDGTPAASPVYFASLLDFSIYFSTSHHTQKFKNLTLNPKVTFSVGHGPNYEVVTIHGQAKLVDEKEREEGLELISDKVQNTMNTWPIRKDKSLEEGGIALFKIIPKEVYFLNISGENDLSGPGEYYNQVFP